MSVSDASAFFQSRSFKAWRDNRDAQIKLDVAAVERLNSVIRGLNIVVKTIARTR